ncbi:hypothetical protein [Rhodonellum sp.]|uniref:hypothetical protein n=1 Tax=Rhodonellum sp. TaxID=2231180 RepID=UPI0027215B5B|nr:hypothetical protein [Rhodonellum sp.]MDO9554544.1 hypothetical protein [Rhodonellum sp.]
MEIHKIIYDSTREILNVEDKLRIATVFIFCEQIGIEKMSELLYSKNHAKFIEDLNNEYLEYEVDFTVNLNDLNVRNSFFKTLEKVKKKVDSDGFLKALFEGDEYALAICGIVNFKFDKFEFRKITKKIADQLSLWN